MPSFPTLSRGTIRYPFTLSKRYPTQVIQFGDDSEQRWASAPGLMSFRLEFRDLNGYDLSLIRAFFLDSKGQFDKTWDLTIGADTYSNLSFDSDVFPEEEPGSKPNLYNLTLPIRQVKGA